jgi:hypothetical protein
MDFQIGACKVFVKVGFFGYSVNRRVTILIFPLCHCLHLGSLAISSQSIKKNIELGDAYSLYTGSLISIPDGSSFLYRFSRILGWGFRAVSSIGYPHPPKSIKKVPFLL